MFYYKKRIRTYEAGYLSNYFEKMKREIDEEIKSISENHILNADETEFIERTKKRYSKEIPSLHFDKAFAKTREEDIPKERFPYPHTVFSDKIRKNVIAYHIPFTGDIELLKYQPTTWTTTIEEFEVSNNHVVFEIIQFNDNDVSEVKREYQDRCNRLARLLEHLTTDLQNWNSNLENLIRQTFQARKDLIIQRRNALADLGVPIKNEDGKDEA